jgi:hypothetical protein
MTDDPQADQNQSAQTGGAQPAGAKPAQDDAKKSRIPDYIREKYPNLEALIHSTESMTKEEREYWFQILPIMTDQQIDKLKGILVHEKEQLAKLDKQYETELSKLNQKHIMEWKEQERREKRESLKTEEKEAEVEEDAAEAELLKQLEGMDEEEPPGDKA